MEQFNGIYEELTNMNIDDPEGKDDDKDDNDALDVKQENAEFKHLTFDYFKPGPGVESYDF